jgi:hypothetical protein
MRFASLTGLKTRLRGRVDSSARGSDVPAGIERGADAVAPSSARQRGRLRRRLRELRRLREAQLLELGALVLEAHKHDRDVAPIVETKIAEAAATDREVRAIAAALDTDAGVDTIVVDGIAGPCPTCGTLVSTSARFCSACATPLDGRPDAAPQTDSEQAQATPLLDAREAHAADARAAERRDAAEPSDHEADDRDDPEAGDRDDHETSDPSGRGEDARTTELGSANGHASKRGEVEATTGHET